MIFHRVIFEVFHLIIIKVISYYSSVRATPFAFRATQKEVCLYAERLPSFFMLRWKINGRKFKHIFRLEKYGWGWDSKTWEHLIIIRQIADFRRQLAVPLINMEATMAEYKEFLEGKPVDPLVEEQYKKALEMLSKREAFEDSLQALDDAEKGLEEQEKDAQKRLQIYSGMLPA